MNINRLAMAIESSPLNKVQIAERCGISRTTLDNVLSGSDAKISTIESLAKVLNISMYSLFEDADNDLIHYEVQVEDYKKEIERLKSLLQKKMSTKVVVELDVDNDEFIKMGLKDKIIQILAK